MTRPPSRARSIWLTLKSPWLVTATPGRGVGRRGPRRVGRGGRGGEVLRPATRGRGVGGPPRRPPRGRRRRGRGGARRPAGRRRPGGRGPRPAVPPSGPCP